MSILAPDIYAPDVKQVLADYDFASNPLFVAESQFKTGDLFWALGQHKALGYSLFGIDDGRVGGQLSQALALLDQMHQVIMHAQTDGRIAGVLMDDDKPQQVRLGRYNITVRDTQALLKQMLLDVGLQAPPPPPPLPSETEGEGVRPTPGDARPYGLIIDEGNDTFLLVGKGFTADFATDRGIAEVDRVEDGHFEAGGWKVDRIINGDERLTVIPIDHIGMARVRLLPAKGL